MSVEPIRQGIRGTDKETRRGHNDGERNCIRAPETELPGVGNRDGTRRGQTASGCLNRSLLVIRRYEGKPRGIGILYASICSAGDGIRAGKRRLDVHCDLKGKGRGECSRCIDCLLRILYCRGHRLGSSLILPGGNAVFIRLWVSLNTPELPPEGLLVPSTPYTY